MKKIALLFVLLLVVLSGCGSSKQEEVKVDYKLLSDPVNGLEVYKLGDLIIPTIFGYPEYTNKEIMEIDEAEAENKIKTIPDLLNYVVLKNVDYSPYKLTHVLAPFLTNTYDEFGYIDFIEDNDYFGINFVLIDGLYYPFSMFDMLKSEANYNWMNWLKTDKVSFKNYNEMIEELGKTNNHTLMGKVVTLESGKYEKKENIMAPNGENYLLFTRQDEKVFTLHGATLFYDLGLPELTLDEIKELVNSEDKTIIADKINTVADAINYLYYAEYQESNSGFETNEVIAADFGNIYYKDEATIDGLFIAYAMPGLETLMLNKGQCTSTSTLFNYLLKDDYPELGYVLLDGHCIIYVQGQNGKYYLVDPANYIKAGKESYSDPQYLENSGYCDESLQILMERFGQNCFAPGTGTPITFVYTIVYNGVYTADAYNPEIVKIPEDAEGTVWYGNRKIEKFTPKHSTSQTNIINIEKMD